MTAEEAIKEFKDRIEFGKKEYLKDIPEYIEALDMAIEALEKAEEYRRLEEQGLLLRLPCKVGDTVYLVSTCGRSDIDGRFIRVIEEKTFSEFWLRDIGKTVFLTYGEAVAKLKEMEG